MNIIFYLNPDARLKIVLSIIVFVFFFSEIKAQCCAGGSGSPIAGGASQGVLLEKQFEINTNLQFINTDRFYSKNQLKKSGNTFDAFSSIYEYLRLAYGVTKNLTISVESGYYFNKKETGLNKNPSATYESKGFGDLILFPRYDIVNRIGEKTKTEVTLGLGFKIPLGSYNATARFEEEWASWTVIKPQVVQLSSGAQDLIFYTFLYHGFNDCKSRLSRNSRIFANTMYIKKGWNPNGEKLGDFASIGLFAGKSFYDRLGITLQARLEWMDRMKINEAVLLFGKPSNNDPEATGYKKVFISPQVSFTQGKFTFYGLTDFPVYQYLNSNKNYTQAGSKFSSTFGISYKFFAPLKKGTNITATYECPMHPDEKSDKPSRCSKCGMDLEKK